MMPSFGLAINMGLMILEKFFDGIEMVCVCIVKYIHVFVCKL